MDGVNNMAYETGNRVQAVTPARRKKYERNLFYTCFSSSTDPGVASTFPCNLFIDSAIASSTFETIQNVSTRLDWLHLYFNPTGAASSFYVVYCDIDTTTKTHSMILSTAVVLKNSPCNWVIPLPPRTEMYPVVNNSCSSEYFMFQCAEAFGDQLLGNK